MRALYLHAANLVASPLLINPLDPPAVVVAQSTGASVHFCVPASTNGSHDSKTIKFHFNLR